MKHSNKTKPIRLSSHAKENLIFRGTSTKEVEIAIKTSQWKPAELGRIEARKNFTFEKVWNKKYYKIK